jgi:hypothetical protein
MVMRVAQRLLCCVTRKKGGISFTTAGLCNCEPKLNSALNWAAAPTAPSRLVQQACFRAGQRKILRIPKTSMTLLKHGSARLPGNDSVGARAA